MHAIQNVQSQHSKLNNEKSQFKWNTSHIYICSKFLL